MALKIKLTKASEPHGSKEVVFDEETVSIGRGETNSLLLKDKLVSKAHAKIDRQEKSFAIADLQSTNGTFLNGERLIPGTAYALRKTDKVRIADFELEVLEAEISPVYQQEKGEIADAAPAILGDLAQREEVVSVPRAAEEPYDGQWRERNEQLEKECLSLREENHRLAEQLAEARRAQKEQRSQSRPPALTPDSDYLAKALLVLMAFLSKLAQGRASFITEFFGFTVVPDAQQLPRELSSGEKALAYVADPSLTAKEKDARLMKLKNTTEQIILHMMGLMEGYRRSVDEGARALLDRTDPESLKRELSQAKLRVGPWQVPYAFIPFLLEWKVIRLARQRRQDLQGEDRGVLEKRYFRPSFVHGYEGAASADAVKRREESDDPRPDR